MTSKDGRDGSIPINQDADLFLGKLQAGNSVKHSVRGGRHAWVQVIAGELDANGTRLTPGDAAAISKTDLLVLNATEPSDFLVFDLN